jgi:DegV family protein with EDD domain
MSVSFGDRHFTDGEDLSPELFFKMLKSWDTLPKTSQPSPFRFEQEFCIWSKDYTDIICVCISSRLSGTYGSAMMAKQAVEEDPGFTARVHVIDTFNASVGILVTVLRGAEYAVQGHTADEVLKVMDESRRQAALYFILDTLEYLHRGGRIGLIKSVVGSLLNIKPIMTVRSGVAMDIDKARGMAQAKDKLLDLFARKAADLKEVIIVHAHCLERATELAASFTDRFSNIRIRICQVGATIGVYSGEGGLGFAMLEKEPHPIET